MAMAETIRFKASPDAVTYATLAQNGNSAVVIVSKEQPKKLPQLIERKEFATFQEAQNYFEDISQSWPTLDVQAQNHALALEDESETLWPVTEQWSKEWEDRYTAWVTREVNADFFRDTLATDCADVVYATRWIFARNNHLPMVNRLGGSRLYFGHFSMKKEWKEKKQNPLWHKDQRFMAALEYMLSLTYTESLVGDSYPLKISPETLRAGSHFTYVHGQTGHNYLVTQIRDGKDGRLPITVSFSTLPKQYRRLAVNDFNEPHQPKEGGFMQIRWPEEISPGVWKLKPSEAMPDYSLEQYQPEFISEDSFDEAVFNRVAPQRVVDPKRKVKSLVYALLTRFTERVPLVEDALRVCYPNRCAPNSRDYEDYSTPSRDRRIKELIDFINLTVDKNPETKWTYKLFTWNNKVNLGGPQFETYEITLAELIKTWEVQGYTSDPNDSLEKRWGLR